MTNKKYKYVFIDFDDTIVRTLTGNTFPKGIWDMQIIQHVAAAEFVDAEIILLWMRDLHALKPVRLFFFFF